MCEVLCAPRLAESTSRCGTSRVKVAKTVRPKASIRTEIENHLDAYFDRIFERKQQTVQDRGFLAQRFGVDLDMLALCDATDFDYYAQRCDSTPQSSLREHLRRQLLLGHVHEYPELEILELQTIEVLPPRNPDPICSITAEELELVAESRVQFGVVRLSRAHKPVLVELDLLWSCQIYADRCRELYAREIQHCKDHVRTTLDKRAKEGRCTAALRDAVLAAY
jgi:hypothetical protein